VNWHEDRSRLIADAYELRGNQGVALLSRMGSFDLWRGSLARMRGDSPTEVATDSSDAANTERFLQALSVSRALDAMPDECAEVLRLACFDRRDGSVRYDQKLAEFCTKRLLVIATVIYQKLSSEEAEEFESDTNAAIPPSTRTGYNRTPAERK
jgi:hypothetical protein